MKALAVALMAVAAIVLGISEAEACQCGTYPPYSLEAVKKQRDEAVAVFAGQVVVRDDVTVTFRVQKIWKGAVPTKLTMATGAVDNGNGSITTSSCEYYFEPGKRYLVFAYGRSLSDMSTHYCTFSAPLAHASDTVRKLDKLFARDVRRRQ